MTPYYSNIERVFNLIAKAESLIGTPFAAHSMVPQCGMDCIHVNAWCYLHTGFLKEFNPPPYALDSGSHAKESQLLKWLNESFNFHKLPFLISDLMAGDTICFNMGLSEHHVGLVIGGGDFVHILPKPGRAVIKSSLIRETYYSHRVSAVYRPMI